MMDAVGEDGENGLDPFAEFGEWYEDEDDAAFADV